MTVEMYFLRNNRWIQIAKVANVDGCHFLNQYLTPGVLSNFFKTSGLTSNQCPVPTVINLYFFYFSSNVCGFQGVYHMNKTRLNMDRIQFPTFPLGSTKVIFRGHLKENNKPSSCVLANFTRT